MTTDFGRVHTTNNELINEHHESIKWERERVAAARNRWEFNDKMHTTWLITAAKQLNQLAFLYNDVRSRDVKRTFMVFSTIEIRKPVAQWEKQIVLLEQNELFHPIYDRFPLHGFFCLSIFLHYFNLFLHFLINPEEAVVAVTAQSKSDAM